MAAAKGVTDVVIKRMDLTSRSLDLVNTLVSQTGPVAAVVELCEWLRVERVPKQALARCLEQAAGIAYANHNGLAFFSRMLNAPPITEAWPLALKQSGALGRRLIEDPYRDWMVSTTASLMQFHNHQFVSQALCSMIMQQQNEGAEKRLDAFELRYVANRIEIKTVVEKLVTSVWYNVVNSGNQIDELPDSLKQVCSRGHHITPDQFGQVTHALRSRREKVIIESTHLLGNLTLWLLLHFHGWLTVTVSGKVLFEKDLSDPGQSADRTIELKVLKFCKDDVDCSTEEDTYRLYDKIKGSVEEFLSGSYPPASDQPPAPITRRPLYEILRHYDTKFSVLSEAILADAKRRSQRFVSWLLGLSVISPQESEDFNFSIRTLEGSEPDWPFRVGDLLGRSPAILNFHWGQADQDAVVFAPYYPSVAAEDEQVDMENAWEDEQMSDYGHDGNPPFDLTSDQSDEIIAGGIDNAHDEPQSTGAGYVTEEGLLIHFPLMRDLVKKAKQECRCHDCVNHRRKVDEVGTSVNTTTVPKGCLAQLAIWYVLLLVAHAIADAFGAPNASGKRDPKAILRAMTQILYDLVEHGEVRWDAWFSLAACVDLGCPYQSTVMDIEFTGTSYAAIQFGNLTVMAPWLDITAEQEVKHCFRYNRAEGVIGVLQEEGNAKTYVGIQERYAILQPEHTEDTTGYAQRFTKVAEPLTGRLKVDTDDSSCALEVIILPASEIAHRVIMRYVSDTTRRIVDPVAAMIRLAKSIPEVECKHADKWKQPGNVKAVVKYYTFDDLLGYWQNEEILYGLNKVGPPSVYHGRAEGQAPGLTYHISSALDSHAKMNAARSLTVNNIVIVNEGKCCMDCALEKARTFPVPANLGPADEIADRFIINSRRPQSQVARSKKRKI